MLNTTIDWTYDLLSAAEQRAFRQFPVFAGDFGLEVQAKTILAVDFFHVDTVFLRRLQVLFLHRARHPASAADRITAHPMGE